MKPGETREAWSTKKRDNAPRGVFRHASGVWAIRFTCGAGCLHKERVGVLKGDAVRAYHERRARAHDEPGWCPGVERQQKRDGARAERARERARMTFADYARDFMAWARVNHRSWTKDDSRLSRVLPVFGERKLDEITTADVERFLDGLTKGERAVSPATRNRYRDLLSGMFKRAIRLGRVATNPVRGIPKVKEPGGRVVYLTPEEEQVVRDALPPDLRPLFTVSVHTGFRWSEQARVRWADVDALTGIITVPLSKNGYARRVPMNSTVRSVLFDLGANRARPDDAEAPIFRAAYRTTARALERAVQRSQEALREAGKDASRLDGYTWHGNRHTFASRLVMAGVDPLSVRELGGWRTLAMVQRYAHLAPGHLAEAVERIAATPMASEAERPRDVAGAAELTRNYPATASVEAEAARGVS